MKYDYAVFIHRLYFSENPKKGGLDLFLDYFQQSGKRVFLVEMPLNYSQKNIIRTTLIRSGENETVLQEIKMPIRNNILNWGLEFFICLYLGIKYKTGGAVVISSDPLTTLPALFLRKIGFYRKHYYHSVDYSTDRFKNKVMNLVYKILLIGGIRYADVVGVVTQHAKERLKKYRSKEIIFVPNSPDFEFTGIYRKNRSDRIKNSLVVTCADVSSKFKIMEMIKLTEKLLKKFPDVSLHVLGYYNPELEYCRELDKYVNKKGLNKNVIFYSQVPRETNLEIISRRCVGLAFYDTAVSHIKYGDSLKIREYAALGLPTISDTHTQTALEMEDNGAGCTANDFKKAQTYIENLFSDPAVYEKTSNAALAWAKKMDKKVIMERIVREHFSAK